MESRQQYDPSRSSQGYLERGLERLKESGFKLTRQRRAILELFDTEPEHLTPKEIFERLEPEVASLSLATVYNTLELFEDEEIVARITSDKGETYFDPNVHPHHHAVCNECGSIFDMDVEDDSLQALAAETEAHDYEETDFDVEEATVWFRGVCERCR